MTLIAALWVLLVLSLVLTTVQTFVAVRFLKSRTPLGLAGPISRPAASTRPPRVSILKPLCGLDARLRENLECFAALSGFSWELLLSVADPRDPAVAVAEEFAAAHPGEAIRVIVGGAAPGRIRNPKVERLVAAAREATGDVLFISDANACVSSEDVLATVALFADPKVGCVSNLFTGDAAESFGAEVEALHLLTFVLPGTTLAAAAGIPCVVGKSMALSRAAHEAIGGFATVGDVLAEDQALGLAVREAGFEVVLSPRVARNVLGTRTLKQALARQVRWGQIRRSLSLPTFFAEVLLNPFAIALGIAALSAPVAPALLGTCALLAAVALALRVGQAALLGRATRTRVPLALVPLKDLLQLGTWLVPFASRTIAWQRTRARLGEGTLLMPV